jgi:hypothetical protein
VSLETLKDFCIGSLHLVIALWVSNESIANFYAKIFTVLLECTAGELGPVVSDDPIGDPKPTDDGLDELDYRSLVDGDIEIPIPSDGSEKWPQDVQPPKQRMAMRAGSFAASVLVCGSA